MKPTTRIWLYTTPMVATFTMLHVPLVAIYGGMTMASIEDGYKYCYDFLISVSMGGIMFSMPIFFTWYVIWFTVVRRSVMQGRPGSEFIKKVLNILAISAIFSYGFIRYEGERLQSKMNIDCPSDYGR